MVYVLFLCASMNFAYQPCEVHACHQTNSPLGFSVNFTSTVALYLPNLSIHACNSGCLYTGFHGDIDLSYVHTVSMYMYMICDLVLHKYAHSLFICAEY